MTPLKTMQLNSPQSSRRVAPLGGELNPSGQGVQAEPDNWLINTLNYRKPMGSSETLASFCCQSQIVLTIVEDVWVRLPVLVVSGGTGYTVLPVEVVVARSTHCNTRAALYFSIAEVLSAGQSEVLLDVLKPFMNNRPMGATVIFFVVCIMLDSLKVQIWSERIQTPGLPFRNAWFERVCTSYLSHLSVVHLYHLSTSLWQ